MTAQKYSRGLVYRCPVCGAELAIVSKQTGDFHPRCCNVLMEPKPDRLIFYRCPRCGSELMHINQGNTAFKPRCCNIEMHRLAA